MTTGPVPYPRPYCRGYDPYLVPGECAWSYTDPYALARDMKRQKQPKHRLRILGGKFYIFRSNSDEWHGPFESIEEAVEA